MADNDHTCNVWLGEDNQKLFLERIGSIQEKAQLSHNGCATLWLDFIKLSSAIIIMEGRDKSEII
ncbi:hypothetical protein [Bacillus piscicola]|uniref:hypothetical protein n=1 Tax=Bacillus piscicola TaxID=1632684 RepID=UPI001F09D06C|nr:hypothetical protein [Bacillus piscicola]